MENISALGPTAGAVAVVILFLRYLSDERKAQANRDRLFSAALVNLTDSNNRVAAASERAADEAKDRNGHMVELMVENQRSTLKAISALKDGIKEQHVKKQVVAELQVNSTK